MTKLHFHKEKNFFMEWLMLHEMPTGEIALWHTLMNIGNRLGQKRTFNVPTSTLMKLTGLSKQGLMKARKRLMERGFIRYEKGSQRKAPIYEMIPITEEIELYAAGNTYERELPRQWTKEDTRKLTSPLTKECTKELTIHKDKNKKEKRRGGGSTRASYLFDMYEENMHALTPVTRQELNTWIEDVGEAIVEEAIRTAVKKGGRTFSYVEAILNEWMQAGMDTIQDVEDYEQSKLAKSRKRIPFRKQRKRTAHEKEQSLEEWLQEELA